MFNKFSLIVIILVAYVYLASTDSDKTLYTKAKNLYCKYYKDVQKIDLKVKVNKPIHKEKRFF